MITNVFQVIFSFALMMAMALAADVKTPYPPSTYAEYVRCNLDLLPPVNPSKMTVLTFWVGQTDAVRFRLRC